MADGEDAAPAARLRTVYSISNYLKERLRELRARPPFTPPPHVTENLNNATKDFAEIEGNLEGPLECVEDLTGGDFCPCGNELCGYVYVTKRWGGYPSLATEAEPRDRPREEMTGGEITGEVLYPVANEHFIVEPSCGTTYYCQSEADKEKLTSGTRVIVDMTTSTIMREEVDYVRDQMRRLRELVELPFTHLELFRSIGVKPRGKIQVIFLAIKKSQEILPPSCLENSSPVACPGSIVAWNGQAERCPRATTVQKVTVDCSGKDRKRIVGVVAFSRILFAPPPNEHSTRSRLHEFS